MRTPLAQDEPMKTWIPERDAYLDELLHARADVEGVHIGVLLGGGIVKLGVRERLWIGGDVWGGHCGVNGGDARGYRVAQIS